MKYLVKSFYGVLLSEFVGLASTPFTLASIPTWYQTLHKPPFTPANWIFGPVWTLLYALMGIALGFVWVKGLHKKSVKIAFSFFLAQLAVNFLWSAVFFGMRSPLLGLFIIVVLLTLIVITMRTFYPVSKTAFILLIPYFLWVSFATILNIAIVVLN